jgi:hypothetical protein
LATAAEWGAVVIFAYADPPYPGQAERHYSAEDLCAEVDHADLIGDLEANYPDGWALSTSSTSLQYVLSVAPEGVRVGAWVKPFCSWKFNVNPAYAWEPVIFKGGRDLGNYPKVRDWVSCGVTLKRGLAGAKPDAFNWWIFRLLGATKGDELHDLFPGSGAVSASWETFCRQADLFDQAKKKPTDHALELVKGRGLVSSPKDC